MAGSLKWFTYVDNLNNSWALFADESNVEAIHGTAGSGAPAGQNYKPPSNLRPRFAVFSNQSGTRNVKVPILTEAVYNALDGTDTIPDALGGVGATLSLSRIRPEVVSPIPTLFDTGIDDGDN